MTTIFRHHVRLRLYIGRPPLWRVPANKPGQAYLAAHRARQVEARGVQGFVSVRLSLSLPGLRSDTDSFLWSLAECHCDVFPGVLAALRRAHIYGEGGLIAPPVSSPHELRSFSNQLDYSIHLYDFPALNKDPILVATMRYVGDDFARDMREVSEDPETHGWWTMVRRFVRFRGLDSCITSAFVPET